MPSFQANEGPWCSFVALRVHHGLTWPRMHARCAHFTYDQEKALCFLKRSEGSDVRSVEGLISGQAF